MPGGGFTPYPAYGSDTAGRVSTAPSAHGVLQPDDLEIHPTGCLCWPMRRDGCRVAAYALPGLRFRIPCRSGKQSATCMGVRIPCRPGKRSAICAWEFGYLVGRVSAAPPALQRCAFSSAISFGVVRQQPPISFALRPAIEVNIPPAFHTLRRGDARFCSPGHNARRVG